MARKKVSPTPKKKAELALNGREAAVNFTRDRSYVWIPSSDDSVNPPAETRRDILSIARYLTNNFALCERALTVCENYAVGQGLIANAATEDKDYNKSATDAFDNWANSVFCSDNHSLTFYQMQKLLVREVITAGEAFLIMQKAANGYPQLRLVKAEDVRHSGEKEDTSVDGIYYDDYGKAVQYNIFFGKRYIKVDAANVIHLLRPKNRPIARNLCFRIWLKLSARFKRLIPVREEGCKNSLSPCGCCDSQKRASGRWLIWRDYPCSAKQRKPRTLHPRR